MTSGLPGITEGYAEKSGDIVDICIQQSREDESRYQPQNSPNELLTFHLRLLRVDPRYLGVTSREYTIPNPHIWVCLKIGYIPNYSHLIGIMIINHWV